MTNEESLYNNLLDTEQRKREVKLLKAAQYREANREMFRVASRKHYRKNIAKFSDRNKLRYMGDRRERTLAAAKEYNQRPEVKRRLANRIRILRKTSPRHAIYHRASSRIRSALKGREKFKNSVKLIGCSIDFLRAHLENQFLPGMSWTNFSEWHIDHIRPCARFDLSIASEQRRCFHWTNLQPLWKEDNQRKSDHYDEQIAA